MTTRHQIIAIIFIGLVASIVWLAPSIKPLAPRSVANAPTTQASFARGMVTIHSHQLNVDLALDEAAWKQGMMHRKDWGATQGMLFVFPDETMLNFWMKNTYLPLDIVFINQQLQVVNVVADTTPLSANNVTSTQPAKYVLELPAGKAETYQLEAGTTITWSMK